ncbi:MAG: hypothetical protein RLZZ461_1752, partial [Planctomycetota bacterium]
IQVEWDDRGNCTTRAFEIEGTVLRRDFTQCLTDLAGRPVFGRLDGKVFRWSEPTPTLLFRASGWIQAAHQIDDETWLSGNHNGRVELIADGSIAWSRDLRRAYVIDLVALPDRDRCFALTQTGDLHVLSLDTGERICRIPINFAGTRNIHHDPKRDVLLLVGGQSRRELSLSESAPGRISAD